MASMVLASSLALGPKCKYFPTENCTHNTTHQWYAAALNANQFLSRMLELHFYACAVLELLTFWTDHISFFHVI